MEERIVEYDKKADILYLWYEDPSSVEEIITERTDDDVLIDRNAETGEVIGFSVMHLSQRDSVDGFKIPAPV